MIKVIVFDFDGVIVDSTKLKHEAWFSFFPKENVEANAALQKVHPILKHESRYNIIRAVLQEMDTPKDTIEPLVVRYADAYGKKVEDAIMENGFMPGAYETLSAFSEQYPMYANSGTPERELRRLFERLGIAQYFKNIYGRPAVGDEGILVSKEENFKKIMKEESVSAQDILMIGDSDTDVSAAKNIGCAFVGVVNNANQWDEKKPFPVVRDLRDIEPLLKSL